MDRRSQGSLIISTLPLYKMIQLYPPLKYSDFMVSLTRWRNHNLMLNYHCTKYGYNVPYWNYFVFSHLLVCSFNAVGNGQEDKQDQQAKYSLSLVPEPGWRRRREWRRKMMNASVRRQRWMVFKAGRERWWVGRTRCEDSDEKRWGIIRSMSKAVLVKGKDAILRWRN